MQDPDNYVLIRGSKWNVSSPEILLVRDGQVAKTMVEGNGEGVHWRVDVIGDIYKVFVDGKLVLLATDETFMTGSVGLAEDNSGKQ